MTQKNSLIEILFAGHSRAGIVHFRLFIFGTSDWIFSRFCMARTLGFTRFETISRQPKTIRLGISGK